MYCVEEDALDWEFGEHAITGWEKQEKLECATYEIEEELKKLFGENFAFDDNSLGLGTLAFIEDNFVEEPDKLCGYPG